MIIHALIDDDMGSGGVSVDFQHAWADYYELDFPVVDSDGSTEPYNETYYGLASAGLNEGYIPYFLLIDKQMRLSETIAGGVPDSTMIAKVDALLAE